MTHRDYSVCDLTRLVFLSRRIEPPQCTVMSVGQSIDRLYNELQHITVHY